MQLKSLTISNLRGIKSLTCERLAPITLIGGCNNCGKSTFLEAIKLLSARKDASAAPDINLLMRQINLRDKQDIQVLFNNPNNPIEIKATMEDDVSCSMTMSLAKKGGGDWPLASSLSPEALANDWKFMQHGEDSSSKVPNVGWDNELSPRIDENGQLRFRYTSSREESSTDWKCMLLSANTRSSFAEKDVFGKMMVALQDRKLNIIINKIYPEIFTVKLVNNKLMVKVRGYDNLIPAKAAGDGVVRMISVLCCLWNCSGGCLCVDEIDNGLHYSVLLDFWRAVAEFVEKFNVQLVATTHHLEMLETLNRMVKEHTKPNLAEYVRLSCDESKGHVADIFNGEELGRALKFGLELRG